MNLDTFIVEQLLIQSEENELFRKRLINRLKFETCTAKRNNFLAEIGHVYQTNKEIQEMLLLAYQEGISSTELVEAIWCDPI